MSRDYEWSRTPSPESVSRLVNFTDAVVGIAVTLLVLPVVDIEPPEPGESLWTVMAENRGTLLSFVLSFVITLMFWRRHHRMFDGMQAFSRLLLFLNGTWLLALVFLQFPTEMLGHVGPADGIFTVYALTLAVLSWLGLIMIWEVRRTEGIVPRERQVSLFQVKWSTVTSGYLTILALLSIWWPQQALWLMLGLAVIGWAESWALRRRRHNQPVLHSTP